MGISGAMVAEALTAAGHGGRRDRPARAGPRLDGGDDGAGAVRDRPAARRQLSAADRPRRGGGGLAAVPAGGRQPRGPDRGARHPLRPGAAAVALPRRRPCSTPAALREEAAARRAAGIVRAYLDAGRARARPTAWPREAAILSHDNLALDPRKLTAGLWRARAGRGAPGCTRRSRRWASSTRRDGVEVATAGGPVISAGHVVLATGYELTAPRAGRGARGHLDLGDRHAAAAAAPLAARGDDLGGVRRPISTCGRRRTAG